MFVFQRPDIVLVHYLNVTAEEIREGQPLHVRIAQSIIASGQNFTRSQIEQQIRPICKFCSCLDCFTSLEFCENCIMGSLLELFVHIT